MKKMRKYLLCLIVLCCTVIAIASLPVQATENEDLALINNFYSALNDKNYVARAEMTVGDYHDMLVDITENAFCVENRLGFYNVESVNEVEVLGSIPVAEYPDLLRYATEISTEYQAYLVRSDITAYEDTEFYFTGERYDIIFVGTVEESRKIISVNTALDSTVRNYMQDQGISTYMLRPNICLPVTIRVKLANGSVVTVDFKEYCKKVACSEVGYDSYNTNYHKASCIALKNYAYYRRCIEPADNYFHINATTADQIYDPNVDCSPFPNLLSALDEVWNIFITDTNGNIMITEYRSGKEDRHQQYATKASGVMLHSNAIVQANEEWLYTDILEYAYDSAERLGYRKMTYAYIFSHVYELQPDGNYKCRTCGDYQGVILN